MDHILNPKTDWKRGWRGRKMLYRKYLDQYAHCAICGFPMPLEEVTKDHIIPRAKGGSTQWDNIQLVHPLCNQRKGNNYDN